MDKLIYVAMTGAKQNLYQQSVVAQNLANVSTTGYREEAASIRATQAQGEGMPTRVYAVDTTTGANLTPGAIQKTGRDLDVAVQGSGWLTVEAKDGSEAYTRNGSLEISSEGILQTHNGLNVLSDGGPISIPANYSITIGKDGTVSGVPQGQSLSNVIVLGKLKLVDPPASNLQKGPDGLFRTRDGEPAESSQDVVVVPGAVEASNVNAIEAMVSMITLSRQFEMQMKLLENAQNNGKSADQLLGLNG
jgi:flagellar basal-body rod protein FlgF